MEHIYLNSVVTNETVNEIKFLSLYYDKVSIINDVLYTISKDPKTNEVGPVNIQFLPSTFEEDYKYLLDEGVLEIVKRNEDAEDAKFDSIYARSISTVVNENFDYIFPKKGDDIKLTDEITNVVKYTFADRERIPIELLWWYYAFKLKRSLKLIMKGERCLNSSQNLQYLLNEYITSHSQKVQVFDSAKLVKNAICMALPSADMLSFEDILELKFRLKDELGQFSDVIKSIELKYKNETIEGIQSIDYDTIFKLEIEKPYNDLQQKIKSLKGRTFLSFIDKAKDIKSYTPILGSVVASIPLKYMLLLSLGAISIETYMEYKLEKNELDNNGFNYLVKLK